MSLETEIKNLAAAIESLNRNICDGMLPILTRQSLQTINESFNVAPAAPVAQAPAPAPVAAPVALAEVLTAAAPAPVAAALTMPAAPTFTPAVVAPAMNPSAIATATTTTVSAPFNDPKSLLDYVMGAYKALGADKGQQIQNVLTQLGYQNINDVKPEHYAQLHAGVEALKA